jgi:hypothetical protein
VNVELECVLPGWVEGATNSGVVCALCVVRLFGLVVEILGGRLKFAVERSGCLRPTRDWRFDL